jgi:hypothetical protein
MAVELDSNIQSMHSYVVQLSKQFAELTHGEIITIEDLCIIMENMEEYNQGIDDVIKYKQRVNQLQLCLNYLGRLGYDNNKLDGVMFMYEKIANLLNEISQLIK